MKRKTLVLFLAATCHFVVVTAQDVHVYYDAFHDSLYYIQNGKSIEAPAVRDGKKIILHVENYNNYLYDVSVEVENTEVQIAGTNPEGGLNGLLPTGGGVKSPLDFLFKGGGDQMLGAFKMFPGLSGKDLKEGSGFGTSPEEMARKEQVAQLKKLESEFELIRDRVFALDEELKDMETQAQAKLVSNRLQTFAAAEIAKLRYNPYLEPKQIKQLSGEYMKRIFQEDDPNRIDLSQVLKIADAQNEIPRYIAEYSRKVDSYAQETTNSVAVAQEFRKFSFPNSNLDAISKKAGDFAIAASTKMATYKDNAQMLKDKMAEVQTLDPQALVTLRTTYMELSNNKFSKTYTHTATGDKMKLKLKLTPLDSLERRGMKEIVTPIEVGVYGGLRVKASVGLSFGQFFNRPKQFFVRDSILQSSNKDAFSPILTSFVHFYAPSNRPVSLAGSFGVGFPISGGENLQSVSFFLGPSLVFGKNERIVLSTGVMGGKADRLSQGYKLGDQFYSDSNDAPTTSVYELGYFLGISFNLSGAN
jgi:hypothetical protein